MALKQATRSVRIFTPLGVDGIHLTGFSGHEEMSRLFHFHLQLVSMNANIKPEDLIGKSLSFSVDDHEGKPRFFHGYVNRFSAGDEDFKGRRGYSVEVVPWLWFLTQRTDCRAFLDKTVVQIIEQVFTELGFTDFETGRIEGEHPVRDYCVQYRETDFAFVSRLMEEEGIYYYFRHEEGKHTLVMADSRNGYSACAQGQVDCPRDDQGSRHQVPHVKGWNRAWQFRPGKVQRTDYDFTKSRQDLVTNEKTLVKFQGNDKYQQYDYPGDYTDRGFGAKLSRIRMEELEVDHDVVQATGTVSAFSPGHRFTIGKHRVRSEEGKGYVVWRIHHEGAEDTYEGGGGGGQFDYSNHVECISDQASFRAARSTARPTIDSCQMAVVVGPEGEEIYTDEYGRVKIKFPWMMREETSYWIRVSQPHAGQNWGYMDIPRVGEEVLVQFMNGNPDYPVIIGRVYNDANMPPFTLPAEKTRRGNKTKTYKGTGFNELSMDDTEGKEQIRIHAQYNMDTVVEHDETHDVGNNRTKTIGVDEQTAVGANRTESVGANEAVTIGANRSHTIGANDTLVIGANWGVTVGSALSLTVAQGLTSTLGKDNRSSVGGSQSVAVSNDDSLSVGGNRAAHVSKNDALSVGKQLVIEAGDSVVIKTGSASIEMKKNGDILIKGKNIKVDASGKVDIKASSDVKIKGSKIAQN